MNRAAIVAVCSLEGVAAILAVGHRRPAGATETTASFSPPKTFGVLHEVMMGNTEPHVTLSDLPQKHLYAVGALSGLRGEVSVLDGVTWLSYGGADDTIKVETKRGSDERAAILVASNVAKWQKLTIAEDVPFSKLDVTVERLARSKNVDVSHPFPVMVEGPLQDIEWHVMKGAPAAGDVLHSHGDHARTGVSRTTKQASATLIGFFSNKDQGVFTHMGSNTHFHVILTKEKLMGHVDSVGLKKGAALYVPR